MRSAVAAVGLVFALGACHRAHRADDELPAGEKTAAVQAIEKLRVAFNGGDCKSIYEDAAAWFRTNEREPDWDRECAEMRKRLGGWQRADVSDHSFEKGGGAAYAEITGQFDAGAHAMYLGWVRGTDGSARLSQFSMQESGAWMSFPTVHGSIDRYRDVPMDIPMRRPIAMPVVPPR